MIKGYIALYLYILFNIIMNRKGSDRMKYTEVQDIFNGLWASKIVNIYFDIIHNSIKIAIEINDTGKISNHIIEFQEVCSYFFLNNIGSKRDTFIKPESGDFLELTSINLIENIPKLKICSEEKWIEQYYSQANVAVEIWSRMLFIEANQVVIDSKIYKLPIN